MKKILEVSQPTIRTYTEYASMFSALSAIVDSRDQENIMKWFTDNYIELAWIKFDIGEDIERQGLVFGDKYSNPNIITKSNTIFLQNTISRDILDNSSNDIYEVIKSYINKGYYMVVNVDWFDLPVSATYKKYHRNHSVFIYGYDDALDHLYVGDYFQSYLFMFTELPVNAFIKGYISAYQGESNIFNNIQCFKYNPYRRHEIDLSKIQVLIQEYLESSSNLYGQKSLESLACKIKVSLDYRDLYLLYEHKKAMCLRFEYLKTLGVYLISRSNKESLNLIKSIARKNVMRLLKRNISSSERLLHAILDDTKRMMQYEKVVLNDLISDM